MGHPVSEELNNLRAIIVDFKEGTVGGNRREVETIQKTLNVVLAEIDRQLRAALGSRGVPQEEPDDATAELLAALDELYPLPDDNRRVERAGRTAAVLKQWMQREEVSLARAAAVILKRDAALSDVALRGVGTPQEKV